MSIAQTYFLAHKARGKLSSEAARPDHNLRLLVGHANLLDSLMLELADAEREQESWFNQSVRGASHSTTTTTTTEDRHIQWADSVEDPEPDWRAEDAESDSDSNDDFEEEDDSELDEDLDDVEMADAVALRRIPSHTMLPHDQTTHIKSLEYDEDEDHEMDDDEDYSQLALRRSPSHSADSSPPGLDDDSDSTEDESMPPSPPTALLPSFPDNAKGQRQQQPQQKDAASPRQRQEDDNDSFYEEGFYLPPRNPARLVSAISVY